MRRGNNGFGWITERRSTAVKGLGFRLDYREGREGGQRRETATGKVEWPKGLGLRVKGLGQSREPKGLGLRVEG